MEAPVSAYCDVDVVGGPVPPQAGAGGAKDISAPAMYPAVLPLSVGGIPFMTTRATLCVDPNSMLAAMFSGRYTPEIDASGRYFIDRDGRLFGHVLEFLRTGGVSERDEGVLAALATEADYYQLRGLSAYLSGHPNMFEAPVQLYMAGAPGEAGECWRWHPAALGLACKTETAVAEDVVVQGRGLHLVLVTACARVSEEEGPRGRMEGCAQLRVNGTTCAVTPGPEFGLFCTIHFAEVLEMHPNDRIRVRNADLPISPASLPSASRRPPNSLVTLQLHSAAGVLSAVGIGHCPDSDVMQWSSPQDPPHCLSLDSSGQIVVRRAGTYLLLARTCVECAALYAAPARLVVNGDCLAELDHRSAGVNHQKLQSYFHEVIYLPAGARVRLHTGGVSAAPPDPLANRLTLLQIGAPEGHVTCLATGCAGPRCPWEWAVHRGNSTLVHVEGGALVVRRGGTYLIMARVPVTSAYNDACSQLVVNETVVAEAWGITKKDRKGIHHFLEVVPLRGGDRVVLQNVNAVASFDGQRRLETGLTLLALHMD